MPIVTYIYTLTDPLTKEIYYIGKTENFERRYLQHSSNRTGRVKGNVYLTLWLDTLFERGLKPVMTVIDTVDATWGPEGNSGSIREQELIGQYWANGHPLLNHINKPKTRNARIRIDARQRRIQQVESSRWWQERMKPNGYAVFRG